jgi:hypothetical protein
MGLILAAALTVAGIGVASAEDKATAGSADWSAQASADGYRTASRLGGSRSLYAACRPSYNPNCLAKAATVKKMAADKNFQKAVGQVMDQAGLTKLTDQVMKTIASGDMKATEFAVGDTLEWMGYYNKGKGDVIRKIRWGGGKPPKAFKAYEFSVEDGADVYNFVVPMACANLALRSVTQKPLPECVTIDVKRDCDKKTMSVSASGASISGDQITRVEVSRGGSKVADLLPAQKFSFSGPMASGRYTFKAYDKYGRQVPICQNRGEQVVEDCPAPPPPPPPPAAATCAGTATAVKVKGGYNVTLDASASGKGASPAKTANIEIVGPAGAVVPFVMEGKTQQSMTLTTPFTTTVFLPKPVTGTYTVRAKVEAENAKAAGSTCQVQFTIAEEPLPRANMFVDGAFGKQRRQYELENVTGTGTIEPGFCDPQLGFKVGALFWANGGRVSFAPAAGIAFQFGDLGDYDYGDNEYNNTSFFLEGMVNFHFSPRGGYIGTGLDWWDVFDGDHNTAAWVIGFGVPVTKTNKALFIGEARLFFDAPDGIDNNYQMWAGMRFVFGK